MPLSQISLEVSTCLSVNLLHQIHLGYLKENISRSGLRPPKSENPGDKAEPSLSWGICRKSLFVSFQSSVDFWLHHAVALFHVVFYLFTFALVIAMLFLLLS